MDNEAALRFLLDTEEIRNLARRYAHCVWQSDAAGAAALFAENGVMETGELGILEGRAAIREAYEETFAASDFRPFVHHHVLEIQEDVATGTCYLELKGSAKGQLIVGWGYYEDDYIRIDGVWYFRRRRLNLLYSGDGQPAETAS